MKGVQAGHKKSATLTDPGSRGDGRLTVIIRARTGSADPGQAVALPAIVEWYVVYYRGHRCMVKIGTYPALSVAAARSKFRGDYASIISSGGEPKAPRARATNKTGATIKDLFTVYVEHLEATASRRYAQQARRVLIGKDGNGGLANKMGATKLASAVEPEDIIPHLAAIHARGSIVMAARVRTLISGAFTHATKSTNAYWNETGAVKWGIKTNPVSAIPVHPDSSRAGQRHLSPEEFRDFWHWLGTRRDRCITADILRIMMVTGQRETEISELQIAQYERKENILDWAKTKNGKPHAIPLPKQAVDILENRLKLRSSLLFPSLADRDVPPSMTAIEKTVKLFIKEKKVPHFCPRDLRRTWKTLAGAAGLSKEIRDRIQNHARRDVSSRHYDRYEYMAEKREAMVKWSAYLERVLGDGAVVVPLPTAA